MSKSRPVRVNVPRKELATVMQNELAALVGEATRNRIATKLFLEMCEPYVPIGTGEPPDYPPWRNDTVGSLRASGRATEKTVIWGENLPYAHYMYEGIVYGPNYKVERIQWPEGTTAVIGFISPKGEEKHPTGDMIEYSEWKPQRHWDEAMIRDNRRLYNYKLTVKLRKLAKEKSEKLSKKKVIKNSKRGRLRKSTRRR